MSIAVCGLDCAACGFYGTQCQGCAQEKGRVFWAKADEPGVCPIYACVEEKQVPHCGECAQLPCSIWDNLREPGITDEEFRHSLYQRQQNLKNKR